VRASSLNSRAFFCLATGRPDDCPSCRLSASHPLAGLRAVATRLHTYISARSYLKEPDGRKLKKVDESQTTHA
jgi:hypothetical protein